MSRPVKMSSALFELTKNLFCLSYQSAGGFLELRKYLKPCPRVKAYFLNDSEVVSRPIAEWFFCGAMAADLVFPALMVHW
jgi:hypothetical protein